MKRFLDLLVDFLALAAFFAAIMFAATVARAGDPCQEWFEVVDGRDVQTNEPVTCDGVQGPRQQFAELLKCASSDLPTCEVKRKAESDKAAKVEVALRKDVQIEKKRGDSHAEENKLLREKLEDLATVEVYEHPAFWAVVGGAVVAAVWLVVEVMK